MTLYGMATHGPCCTPPPGADEAFNALQDARLKLEAAEATLQALQREKRDIELFGAGSTDFGPDDIYLPLAGK